MLPFQVLYPHEPFLCAPYPLLCLPPLYTIHYKLVPGTGRHTCATTAYQYNSSYQENIAVQNSSLTNNTNGACPIPGTNLSSHTYDSLALLMYDIMYRGYCPCQTVLCVVCFLPIYSGRQVRRMYQPGSLRRKVTQVFSSTFAFILLARRIQPFLSLVDREVEFCVLTI